MVATLVIAGLVALGWVLGTGTLRPPADRARRHADAVRLRHVDRHPDQANLGDVARLLRAHDLPETEVRFVVDRAHRHGIAPFTMWVWAKRFDVHALALVVGADLGHAELLGHLAHGTLPDLAELEVLAALNGLPVAARRTAPVAPAATGAAAVQSSAPAALPVIHEPGWPFAA